LGDPFASNLEAFPWFNLQITMDLERGEEEVKEGRNFTVWDCKRVNDRGERKGREVKEDSFYCGPMG
jgi:hypothetical protein